MGKSEQLRELHDTYAWEVNAAVGQGRLDLVWQLADQYVDEAVELITGGEPAGCGRTDCAVCHGPRPTRTVPRRRRWARRGGRARGGLA
jgi:mono/diheme cytochrome c family protein